MKDIVKRVLDKYDSPYESDSSSSVSSEDERLRDSCSSGFSRSSSKRFKNLNEFPQVGVKSKFKLKEKTKQQP